MDYSCPDIPMKLDIKHQPLNFDIYLNQITEVPKTSLDEPPYSFQVEVEALKKVDQIIEREQERLRLFDLKYLKDNDPKSQQLQNNHQEQSTASVIDNQLQNVVDNLSGVAIPPTCPTETLLTPIKGTLIPEKPCTNSERASEAPVLHQVNPSEFEDIQYNPFDHLELQTIDERRELDLVFRASYAGHSREGFFPQPATNDCSTTQEGADTVTKS